jgi:hypothetical protein
MSKNDITNDEIKSRIYSAEARERHTDIFAKRTFDEWLDIEGLNEIACKFEDEFLKEKISYSQFKKTIHHFL